MENSNSRVEGVDLYEEYENLLTQFTGTQKEKDELFRQLQRLKDQQEIIKMKSPAAQTHS